MRIHVTLKGYRGRTYRKWISGDARVFRAGLTVDAWGTPSVVHGLTWRKEGTRAWAELRLFVMKRAPWLPYSGEEISFLFGRIDHRMRRFESLTRPQFFADSPPE